MLSVNAHSRRSRIVRPVQPGSDKDYLLGAHLGTPKAGSEHMVRRKHLSWGRLIAANGFLIILIAAFVTRLLPLAISQYPFNNDSVTECTLASGILSSRHLDMSAGMSWFSTHSGATPAMNAVLAFISSVFGTAPLQCAQVFAAVLSVLTVGCVFLLCRLISGSFRGGIAGSFAAVLMGTFVFTTGSAWKEMMGISLLVLLLVAYVSRNRMEFRALLLLVLVLIPLVHHLVALVALLSVAYLLCWSWFFALANGLPKRKPLEDLVVVVTPIVWASVYYSVISFDRISLVSSPIKLFIFCVSFILVSLIAILVLSMKTHSKWTFAPFVGAGLIAIVSLDYFGYFFRYTPSASHVYFFLVAASGFLFAMAWYGAEVILERRPVYRAVQVALIVSPLSILGYGLLGGASFVSFQIVYRTFDFVDIFVFLGIGTAFVWLHERHRRLYTTFGFITIAFLLLSFPFAYASGPLLGVRHDTQAYEVDSVRWLSEHLDSPILESDERLGHIAEGTVGIVKRPALPSAMVHNVTVQGLPVGAVCLMEDSWTTSGVNDFPYGEVVLPARNCSWILEASNVMYCGGPATDRVVMFVTTIVGSMIVYGSDN
jgi:hypothetical protein